MKTMMGTLLRTLTSAWTELVESESGEFFSTREKSRLLHAMMHDKRVSNGAAAAVQPKPNMPPLPAAERHYALRRIWGITDTSGHAG